MIYSFCHDEQFIFISTDVNCVGFVFILTHSRCIVTSPVVVWSGELRQRPHVWIYLWVLLHSPQRSDRMLTCFAESWVLFLSCQKYRHVDNIMFENHTIANRFLDFWRKTGSQRMGFLYGRYTEHKDIPLGIRAEVAAIYEPPQVGTPSKCFCSVLVPCEHVER